MYSLGLCYEFGDGIEKDMEDAAKWYRKSAEEECESAMYRLGLCYGKGEGVEKSPTEAVKWFKKAAELGDEDAKKQMQQPNPGVFEKEEKTTVASAESAKKNMKERLTDPKTTYSAAWMMWDEYKELSDEDRKDFVTAAEKRAAEAQNSTIVFEGFYAGMPLIDFIAISEQKKVFQKWEKMFSGSSRWHYAEISDAKDLVSRYVITMMMFEGRDWGKLIDCEDDSEVFDQFVHQYVLKKTGKASPLTTLGKAKLEGPDAYDRWWKTYKSTKYGMSVAWCKDKSFLRLMKLGDD